MWRLGWIALLAACSLKFDYSSTQYQCGPAGECPPGQSCHAGFCRATSAEDAGGDGDVDGDAAPDGPGATGRCGTLALLRDSFDAATPWWDGWADAPVTTTLGSGRLTIALPAGNADLWGGYISRFSYDFTGAQLAATVSQVGGRYTVLEVRGPEDQKSQLMVENGLLMATVLGVAGGGAKAQAVYDPLVHRRWRLREHAGMTYWEWSTDGTTWQELYKQANPFSPLHVRAMITAGQQLAQASEARFEDVNLGLADPDGWCPAGTLVDDFTAADANAKFLHWMGAGVTVSRAGGEYVISSNGTSGSYGGFETRHLYDLRDSAVYYEITAAPQALPFQTYIEAVVPETHETRLSMLVEGGTLWMVQRIAGGDVNATSVPYDPSAHRYWRFRVAAGMAYYDTAPDAATWTQRASFALQLDASRLHFIGGAGAYGASAPREARYGGINVP
jgi:hypothetical protein